MSRELYLGTCVFTPKPFSRVRALAQAERGAWRVYDFSQALPREGNAFAPSLAGWDAGDIFAFRVVPNERNDAEKDQYLVDSHERVFEILDFRKSDPELARRALVEVGVPSLLPGSSSVVVALPSGICTVVQMAWVPQLQKYIAQGQALDRLPTFTLDERLFDGDEIEGRWISVPGVTVGIKTGTINWCTDADFLEWVLKRLSKVGLGSPVSRAQAPAVVRYLSDAQLLPAQGEDILQSIERFRHLANHLALNQIALDEIVASLSALEPVDALLKTHREELLQSLRDELEPEVRADLERGLSDLVARKARLTDEIDRANADAAKARAIVAQTQAEAAALNESLVEELSRLGEALDVLGDETLSDSTTMVARITHRLAKAGRAVELVPTASPPWSRSEPITGPSSPWSDAGLILDRAAARWGYCGSDMRLADVIARAGQLLLLPQSSARPFLRSYAWAIAGGALVVEGLHPAVIALDDLWRQPTSREPTGFARAWTAARLDPRRFRLGSRT